MVKAEMAKRSASSGPTSRAVAHSPAGPAATVVENCGTMVSMTSGESRRVQPQPAIHGLENDLMKAQKRTQAKLAALKMQLGNA